MPIANIRTNDISSKILCNRYKEAVVNDSVSSVNYEKTKKGNGENEFFAGDFDDLDINSFSELIKDDIEKRSDASESLRSSLPTEFVCITEAINEGKKHRKKKKAGTICLLHCKFKAVKKIALQFGMREVEETDSWNVYWTDLSVSIERVKEMKRFQKVNHFPGMSEICRKDLLARNLNRMLKMFPKDYNIFPKTWCIPADLGDVSGYMKAHPAKTFILKPDLGCQGRGISLTKSLKDLKEASLNDRMICQVYISKPYLVDGFKFDMRVYTLITSVDPLRIFVYNEGLARFATSRYKEPAGHNTTNLYMHLTNYAVNKHSRTYVVDDEAGSKRKLTTVNQWLTKANEDVKKLWASVDDIIIKTVIAAHPVLKHSYNTCFPNHDIMYACFELLGFDILLDSKLKPYILEVNHSPSFHTDANIDREVKESLLKDVFIMLKLAQCNRKRTLEEDKQRVRDRLLQSINSQSNKANDLPNKTDLNENPTVEAVVDDFNKKVEAWEMSHLGNFRLVYPNNNVEQYKDFFEQNQCSIFQETFASRAREEARRIQKEEFENKLKQELALRVGPKEKEKEKTLSASETGSPNVNPKRKLRRLSQKCKQVLCSFEPTPIEETEEMRRIAVMTQRDYLVRTCRVMEHIYDMLKEGGNLRLTDYLRYGMFERNKSKIETASLPVADNITGTGSLVSLLPKIKNLDSNLMNGGGRNFPVKCRIIEPPWQNGVANQNTNNNKINNTSSNNASNKWPNIRFFENCQNSCNKRTSPAGEENSKKKQLQLPDLRVTCNEVPMLTRPNLPKPSEWPNSFRAKNTKTHIARHFSNTLKIQDLELRLSAERDLKLNKDRHSTL